jgi:regulatory protein YycH of two-component signal transduction system YycFG
LVNRYVGDLYKLPKQFIETTGPSLDKYIKDYSFPANGERDNVSFKAVMDFINQLDEFTEDTVVLFNEHKTHTDKSRAYLRKVEHLNEKSSGRIVSEYAIDYIELTPELTELQKGLKHIKTRADEMVEKLERLELRWADIRVKLRA